LQNRHCLCGVARFAYSARGCIRCLRERYSWRNRPQTAYKFRHARSYRIHINTADRC
jgi:hypothetical protein